MSNFHLLIHVAIKQTGIILQTAKLIQSATGRILDGAIQQALLAELQQVVQALAAEA